MSQKVKQPFDKNARLAKPREWDLAPHVACRGEYEIVSDPIGRVGRLWAFGRHESLEEAQKSWPAGGVFVPSAWLRGRRRPLGAGLKRYKPDVRALLRDVQRVDLSDTNKVLGFISRWGPLGIGAPPDDAFLFDGVTAAIAHLRQVRRWLEAFHALQRRMQSGATWSGLADGLHAHLSGVHLSARATDRGLVVSYSVTRLIDLIWLEVWDRATEGKRLRRCPECGALFPPSRRDQSIARAYVLTVQRSGSGNGSIGDRSVAVRVGEAADVVRHAV
jgi:hypothetical protein